MCVLNDCTLPSYVYVCAPARSSSADQRGDRGQCVLQPHVSVCACSCACMCASAHTHTEVHPQSPSLSWPPLDCFPTFQPCLVIALLLVQLSSIVLTPPFMLSACHSGATTPFWHVCVLDVGVFFCTDTLACVAAALASCCNGDHLCQLGRMEPSMQRCLCYTKLLCHLSLLLSLSCSLFLTVPLLLPFSLFTCRGGVCLFVCMSVCLSVLLFVFLSVCRLRPPRTHVTLAVRVCLPLWLPPPSSADACEDWQCELETEKQPHA